MFTETDVHYLVGLLTLNSSPVDISVELGDMVFDAAAEEDRDVDVTVTVHDEAGGITAFVGILVIRTIGP